MATGRATWSIATSPRRAESAVDVGLTYVPTWRGFVYVVFVIDVFGRRLVGWRVSNRAGSSSHISPRVGQEVFRDGDSWQSRRLLGVDRRTVGPSAQPPDRRY